MANKDEWHSVVIRKPIAEQAGTLSFEEDCFRLGSNAAGGPEWKYEIPFSEIVQIEYKILRDVARGRLRDGTEFEFRFKRTANPAKAARQGQAINAALEEISVDTTDGGSIRPLNPEKPISNANDTAGCMGCSGSILMVALTAVAALIVIVRRDGQTRP